MDLPEPPLLVISDRRQARRPLVAVAEAAFAAGCRWFSLREKDMPADERRDLLAELVALGHRFGAVVTAHDDLDAVIAVAPMACICRRAAIRVRRASGFPAV